MDARRRSCLAWLATLAVAPGALVRTTAAEEAARKVIDVRIENRKVIAPLDAIKITEQEVIELRWTSDEASKLHLHGYDLEAQVRPGEPATMVIKAHATGRFPITSHGWGEGGHGHHALTYLEVHPR